MQSKKTVFLALIGLTPMAFAGVTETLDSLNKQYLGVNWTGSVKGGFSKSDISGTSVNKALPTSESNSNTEFNLDLVAHPTQNIEGLVRLRMHQDWNSAYDEGYNQIIPVWWSLKADVPSVGLKAKFGDILAHRSKLNLWANDIDPLTFEPLMLKDRRQEAMSYKNLNNQDRHFQGVDLDLTQKIDSNFAVSAKFLGARLRNPAWNSAVIQFDNSNVEKWYSLVGVGVEAHGAFAGIDQSWVYDKVRSSRGYNQFAPRVRMAVPVKGTSQIVNDLTYENNSVLNINAGYKMGEKGKSAWDFTARLDYAKSSYTEMHDVFVVAPAAYFYFQNYPIPQFDQLTDKSTELNKWMLNPTLKDASGNVIAINSFKELMDLINTVAGADADPMAVANVLSALESGDAVEHKGSAMLVELDGGMKIPTGNVRANIKYLKNDEKFVSDMAQSYSFNNASVVRNVPNVVMNSKQGALNSGSLFDGLYNYVYQVNPTTKDENLTTNNPLDIKAYSGTNNHYRIGFEKSKWTDEMQTLSERMQIDALDGVSLVQILYPEGYATRNRTGYDVSLSGEVYKGVSIAVMAASNKAVKGSGTYSKMGGGLALDLGSMLDLGLSLKLGGSYEMPKASSVPGMVDLSGKIMSAGADLEVVKNVFVRGAYMALDGGTVYGKETFMGGGLGLRLADAAQLNLEWGKVAVARPGVDYSVTMPKVFMQMAF